MAGSLFWLSDQAIGTTAKNNFFGNAPEARKNNNMLATVEQARLGGGVEWNEARVAQDGVQLRTTIKQYGSGTDLRPNRVAVAQQGRNNMAVAIQHEGTTSSGANDAASGVRGDEFYFAGGARSAEITILQDSTDNIARVEQSGRGQVAHIEQSGHGNSAAIFQLESATNATAIIRQTGDQNSYSITQDRAGQYQSIHQNGNGNIVSSTIR